MLPVLIIFLNGISTSRINGFDGLNDNAEVSVVQLYYVRGVYCHDLPDVPNT